MTVLRDEKGRFVKGTEKGPGKKYYSIPVANEIREELNEKFPDLDVTYSRVIIRAIKSLAVQGNIAAAEFLYNRGYGKLPDIIELNQDVELDLSKLTDEEYAEFKRLFEKVGGDAAE